MKLINKKNDLKSTIPLMALFVALNLIITVYATYLPLSGYVVILFLPLISTIYCLNTKKRYFLIYFLITMILAICFSVQDLTTTLLYLLPALFQGLFFSIFINLNKDGSISYFISVAILFITKISIIPLIDFIYQVNTINSILTLLNLINVKNITYFVYGALFLICTFEMFIVFIITKNELLKLGYKINLFSDISLICIVISALSSSLTLIFSNMNFVYGALFLICTFEMFIVFIITKNELLKLGYKINLFSDISIVFIVISAISSSLTLIFSNMNFFQISYTFLAISIISSIIITVQLIKKNVIVFSIYSSVVFLSSWIIFVALLQHLGFYYAFSTLSIFGICMSLASAIYFIYVHLKMNKD